MKLIEQILNEKLKSYKEYALRREYLKAMWQFYCCYNISASLLGIKENPKEIKIRNIIWKKLFVVKWSEKKFRKIQNFITEDMRIIMDAINYMSKLQEIPDYSTSDIDKPDVIAISSYEMPD